ncbi:hypothetical protein HPT27_01665 [Permianibacter sp. IMCC34836]|uniref:hypothetical protein n=1 Tax=Permianibacter fluminis TaxID=2738515 RepID=UPI00155741A0|nr:hypothetical protein [Permianibacter fluminis]NQD35709.1 hypothetical protein [Permianibacter fluminis]
MDFLRNSMVAVLTLFASALVSADDTVYYTQHNIWLFKGKSATTNYAVDLLVPVNSKVRIDDEDSDELELTLLDGNVKFTVVNIEKHSKQPMAEIKRRLLGASPVDLSKFSALGQQGIKLGDVKPGMTKAEVLVARGYPPGIGTLNTDSDSWKYWHNKFNTKLVQFQDGKVVSIVD